MRLTSVSSSTRPAIVSCDVSACKLNPVCRELSCARSVAEWEIENRTEAISVTLCAIRERALARGITKLRVVVEPTGIYHKLILRIARSLGFATGLVDAGHVKRSIGDRSIGDRSIGDRSIGDMSSDFASRHPLHPP